jgi:hypothetical protein
MEQKLLTNEENTPASEREHKPYGDKSSRDILGRKVVDLSRCGMVLFREREDGRDAYNDKRASLVGNTAFSPPNTNQWLNRNRGQTQRV